MVHRMTEQYQVGEISIFFLSSTSLPFFLQFYLNKLRLFLQFSPVDFPF